MVSLSKHVHDTPSTPSFHIAFVIIIRSRDRSVV